MLKSVFIDGLTRFFCLGFEGNCVKTNEDFPILSATKMFAKDSSFCRYKVYAYMRLGSRARRRKLTVRWSKSVNFAIVLVAIFSEL